MDLFHLGVALHGTVGVAALVSFWVAALARKGGDVHRRAGKVYLVSLIGVMAFATLMVAGKVQQGDPGFAIFYAFLISLVGTASWLTWTSVRRRREPQKVTGGVYRGLATWLIASGAALFGLGVARGRPLMVFLSLLGLGFGANMWRLALAPARDARWWLAHHMNGAMLNFIATHDSFLTIGLGTLVPEVRQPVPRMLIAVSVTMIGIAARAWQAHRSAALGQAVPDAG